MLCGFGFVAAVQDAANRIEGGAGIVIKFDFFRQCSCD
jgi:hypothetical protein